MEQRAERQHEKHALSSLLTCLETTVGANGTEERAAAMRVINTLSLAPRALHKRKGVRAVMERLGLGNVLRAVKEYEPDGEAAAGAGQYEEGCERDAEEEGNVGDVAGLARLVEAQVRRARRHTSFSCTAAVLYCTNGMTIMIMMIMMVMLMMIMMIMMVLLMMLMMMVMVVMMIMMVMLMMMIMMVMLMLMIMMMVVVMKMIVVVPASPSSSLGRDREFPALSLLARI
jgi:hypothetical protein